MTKTETTTAPDRYDLEFRAILKDALTLASRLEATNGVDGHGLYTEVTDLVLRARANVRRSERRL